MKMITRLLWCKLTIGPKYETVEYKEGFWRRYNIHKYKKGYKVIVHITGIRNSGVGLCKSHRVLTGSLAKVLCSRARLYVPLLN